MEGRVEKGGRTYKKDCHCLCLCHYLGQLKTLNVALREGWRKGGGHRRKIGGNTWSCTHLPHRWGKQIVLLRNILKNKHFHLLYVSHAACLIWGRIYCKSFLINETDLRNTLFCSSPHFSRFCSFGSRNAGFDEEHLWWNFIMGWMHCVYLENSSSCLLIYSPAHHACPVNKNTWCLNTGWISWIGWVVQIICTWWIECIKCYADFCWVHTVNSIDNTSCILEWACRRFVCFLGVPFVFARRSYIRETPCKLVNWVSFFNQKFWSLFLLNGGWGKTLFLPKYGRPHQIRSSRVCRVSDKNIW